MVRRVYVLGSSISMIVRPREGLPYPRVLEELLNARADGLWLVENVSTIAATIDDLPQHLPRIVADRPEAVVLHYGHVEPIYRAQSRTGWHRAYGVIIGESPNEARVRTLRRRLHGARRRAGFQRQWTPLPRFERLLRDSVAYIRKETGCRIIVVEANPGDDRIEWWGPGSLAEIAKFNEAMREIVEAAGASWLSLEAALAPAAPTEFAPDGTHLTAEAHLALARALEPFVAGSQLESAGSAASS